MSSLWPYMDELKMRLNYLQLSYFEADNKFADFLRVWLVNFVHASTGHPIQVVVVRVSRTLLSRFWSTSSTGGGPIGHELNYLNTHEESRFLREKSTVQWQLNGCRNSKCLRTHQSIYIYVSAVICHACDSCYSGQSLSF